MGLKIDEDYGGSTLLSEWWSKVKNNFAVVKEYAEFLGSDIEDERITRIDADGELQKQITQLSKLQFTELEAGADIDGLEAGGYFVNWHGNTGGIYPFTGTGILIQFDANTKFQLAMYDGGDGTFFMRKYSTDYGLWGAWYKNDSHTHPNKDVLDNIAEAIETEAQERKAADESLQIEIGTVWDNINLISQEIGTIFDYEDKLSASSVYEAIYNNACSIEEITDRVNLKWQPLNEETVIEDVKTYTYTLPEKCKGIIVDISVPKALDFNASTFNIKEASTNHWHMDQGYTWGKTGATQYNKVLRVYCKPENGYYSTTYADNSGSHPNILAQRWTGATPENKRIDTLYLGIFELTSSSEFAIPAGTVIKIWGLIEE